MTFAALLLWLCWWFYLLESFWYHAWLPFWYLPFLEYQYFNWLRNCTCDWVELYFLEYHGITTAQNACAVKCKHMLASNKILFGFKFLLRAQFWSDIRVLFGLDDCNQTISIFTKSHLTCVLGFVLCCICVYAKVHCKVVYWDLLLH